MTTADLSAIREAVAAAVDAATTGLNVAARYPGVIVSPAAVVVRRSTTFDTAFDIAADHQLAIRMFMSFADLQGSQERLDDWCAPSGAESIRAAIDADPTLGGLVDFCRISGVEDEQIATYARIDYLTVDLVLEVG